MTSSWLEKKAFASDSFKNHLILSVYLKKHTDKKKKKQFRWIQAHSVQPIFQINYLSVRALHIFSWNYCQILQEQQAIRKWKQALNKRLGSKKTSSYYTTATMWHRQTSWSIHKFKQLSVYLKKKSELNECRPIDQKFLEPDKRRKQNKDSWESGS